MTEPQSLFTAKERQFLVDLLEMVLKEKRVEEHRTRTPSFRPYVVEQEEMLQRVLAKLRQAA
jgi:hypothetical protein